MPHLSIIWLVLLIVFCVVEAVTMVQLTSIWFAAGALVALLVSLVTGNIWIQLAAFLIISLVSLVGVRPLVYRYIMPKRQATNADRVIGAEGVVTEKIENLSNQGQVSVLGSVWSARSEYEEAIEVDTKVEVVRIEGVKVFVTKKERGGI